MKYPSEVVLLILYGLDSAMFIFLYATHNNYIKFFSKNYFKIQIIIYMCVCVYKQLQIITLIFVIFLTCTVFFKLFFALWYWLDALFQR